MSHEITIDQGLTKEEKYRQLLHQLTALIEGEEDTIANLSNIIAVLKSTFNWLWVGFYIVKETELVVGPFQGPVACTRIALGKGVCGTAWARKETIVVGDVNSFEGHIACSSDSKSEIVVPILRNNNVIAVLDADSEYPVYFDSTDKKYLEELAIFIADLF